MYYESHPANSPGEVPHHFSHTRRIRFAHPARQRSLMLKPKRAGSPCRLGCPLSGHGEVELESALPVAVNKRRNPLCAHARTTRILLPWVLSLKTPAVRLWRPFCGEPPDFPAASCWTFMPSEPCFPWRRRLCARLNMCALWQNIPPSSRACPPRICVARRTHTGPLSLSRLASNHQCTCLMQGFKNRRALTEMGKRIHAPIAGRKSVCRDKRQSGPGTKESRNPRVLLVPHYAKPLTFSIRTTVRHRTSAKMVDVNTAV